MPTKLQVGSWLSTAFIVDSNLAFVGWASYLIHRSQQDNYNVDTSAYANQYVSQVLTNLMIIGFLMACSLLHALVSLIALCLVETKNREVFTFCCGGQKRTSLSAYERFGGTVMGIQIATVIVYFSMRPFTDSYRLSAENLCFATIPMVFCQIVHGTLLSARRHQIEDEILVEQAAAQIHIQEQP